EVPKERRVTGTNEQEWMSITQVSLRVRSNKQKFHVGANEGEIFAASFGNITPENLGLAVKLQSDGKVNYDKTDYSSGTRNAGPLYQMTISVQTQKSAERAINKIDSALKSISNQRTALGALQNSLEKTHDYINENRLHESESRIRDSDMARELVDFTKLDIMSQASVAMLAQANTKHQSVLQLIQ
ncbi:MAG: flagellin, partial [Candidatus Muiribacteriaceae bacterium]